jgi:hypothetical protein
MYACDSHLIPKVTSALKGPHFHSVDEAKAKTADLLNRVSVDDLHYCSEQWEPHVQ